MRKILTEKGLEVHVLTGISVTLFVFPTPKAACDGLLGFSLHLECLLAKKHHCFG